MAHAARILVVDDQAPFRHAVLRLAAASGHHLVEADTGDAAIEVVNAADEAPFDLALVDVMLGEESGIEVTRRLIIVAPDIQVVLVSTMDRRDLPSDADECGAAGFVPKSMLSPALLDDLVSTTTSGVQAPPDGRPAPPSTPEPGSGTVDP